MGASLGEGNGPVSVGWAGGTEAENLADVLLCGIRSAGGAAIRHDGGCESAAVWLAQTGNYPRSVFVRINDNTVFLRCLSENGLPFSRAQERKLEGALLRGEQHYISKAGPLQTISGIGSRYAKAAATEAFSTVSSFRPFPVAAEGDPSCTQLLSEALSYLGCPIQSPQAGIPIFHLSHGGLRLSAVDESGRFLSPWHMVTLLSQIAFRQGHRAIAVPPEASCGVEQAAEAFQAQVLRLGRDGAAAEQLYIRQHFLRDALFGTLHLCAYLGACRTSLSAVAAQLPPIYTQLREIPLRGNRGAIMEHLSKSNGVMQQKGTESGLHFHLRSGHVYLAPLTRRAAIRIIGEGQSTEIASELCDLFTEKIKKADQIPPSC